MSALPFGALFDMDGVIIHNHQYHTESWLAFAARYGHTITHEDYARYINGRVAKESLPFVFKRALTPDEVAALTEEKEEIYRAMYGPHQVPTTGLFAFLDDLKANGVRMAVGTSAPVSNISFTLDGIGVRRYYDAVVDASMIQNGKPDPEIYLTAAARIGVSPDRCVVFEDAFSGIEAGLRAGMKVIALATTHTRDELAQTGASLVIDDFTQLTAGTMTAIITGA